MTLKFFVAASILAAAPFAALAQQDDSNAQPWMPTIEDAQKLVETISSDKDKLKAYCEIGKLHEQIERAEEENDTKDFEDLVAQLDGLDRAELFDDQRAHDSVPVGFSRCIRLAGESRPVSSARP